MKTRTLQSKYSMNLFPVRLAFMPILLALVCFALSPQARATCQEGCNIPLANTFLGDDALVSNTTGNFNTAIGASALGSNTTGFDNTAVGSSALPSNTTGSFNTAVGNSVLLHSTTGTLNTAIGNSALNSNTIGVENTATGNQALLNVATGNNNTANGSGALGSMTTGNANIAIGDHAGAILNTGSNNIYIGNRGANVESNTIRIGVQGTQTTTSIAGINGATVPNGVGVLVGSNGKLGTVLSSARFKEGVKPMDQASEAILALKPVTFRYRHELDPAGTPQFGLVAEDVEKVNPDLVARDEQGKPYTVRYEAVNAMLLNEFLKEHREVQAQKSTIVRLEKQVEALTAGLQKVSAQVGLNRAAPHMIVNEP